jgi:flagellar biosynthesis protein FlhA
MLAFAVLPGLPAVPFVALGAGAGWLAWRSSRPSAEEQKRLDAPDPAPARPAEEPIATALQIDPIRLELGYGLLALINEQCAGRLTDQIKALRRQLAGELGFVMPSVRIQDNIQLPANTYVLKVKEMEAGRGDVRPNMLLVMHPQGSPIGLPGEETIEPTFGLQAMWISQISARRPPSGPYRGRSGDRRDHAPDRDRQGQPGRDAELRRDAEALGRARSAIPEASGRSRAAAHLDRRNPARAPGAPGRAGLDPRPAARPRGRGRGRPFTQNAVFIIEHVRVRLARQISNAVTGPAGYVPLLTLSPTWEQAFAESLVGQGDERQLAMAPSRLQEFITSLRDGFEQQAMRGELPVLITSPAIRPYVRSIVERFRLPVVLSQNEIHPKAKLRTLGQV